MYLHALPSGDFVPALGQFLGSSAGLSQAVITRLTEQWKAEQRAFAERDMPGADYVYLRTDGIARTPKAAADVILKAVTSFRARKGS